MNTARLLLRPPRRRLTAHGVAPPSVHPSIHPFADSVPSAQPAHACPTRLPHYASRLAAAPAPRLCLQPHLPLSCFPSSVPCLRPPASNPLSRSLSPLPGGSPRVDPHSARRQLTPRCPLFTLPANIAGQRHCAIRPENGGQRRLRPGPEFHRPRGRQTDVALPRRRGKYPLRISSMGCAPGRHPNRM